MSLSADLISQFVKATNDTKKENSETTVYGTIVKYADRFYVQLDGSDQLTPYENTTDVAEGDRVTVRIKNHTATVNGNLKSPAARVDDLDGLKQTVLQMDTVIANKVDTKTLEAETARIDNLVAANVTINGKLTAAEADISKIKTDYLDAKAIEAKYATIENLAATNADIHNLTATYGEFADLTTTRLSAAEAVIDKLDVNYAKIDEFTAVKGKVETLEAGVADIDTLIFGSATGTTIQTSFSNSVIAQLGDAQIKSAMIDSLSASKITAGRISTNTVEIGSDDGAMLLSDETIQINDGTRVRVQIGKDASGDYSINIWDADGKLMFSEGGLTEDAVKDAIIRDDMVSDTANISASKLDINSLFEEINGSDKTIKSTKVYLDEKNQTLDVSFKQMTSNVEGLNNSVSSQGTAISVIQGQISSKIWKQDIDEAAGEMETKYSDLEQSLDGFKMEVGNNYATKEELADIDLTGGNLLSGTRSFEDLANDNSYSEIVESVNGFSVRYADGKMGADGETDYLPLIEYQDVLQPSGGAQYTLSFYAKGSGDILVAMYGGEYNIESVVASHGQNNVVIFDNSPFAHSDEPGAYVRFTLSEEYVRYHVTFTLEEEDTTDPYDVYKTIGIYIKNWLYWGGTDDECYAYGLMLEEGDEPSDWTPSLVDAIGPVVSEKVATLAIKVDSITSRVSTTETKLVNDYYTKTQTNSQIDQKADSIISTVSKTYATQSSVTALDSKIEQLPDHINLAVKSITIGGTNMLRNTKPFKGDKIINSNSTLVNGETFNGFTIRTLDNSSATSGYKDVVSFGNDFPIELEGEYTFSFYAKGSGEEKLSTFFYGPNGYVKVAKAVQSTGVTSTSEDGNTKWTLTNEWKRYWVTWKLKNSGDASVGKWILFRSHFGGTVSICGCQLEKGNKVSDWSYHPEDANEQAASLSVKVDGIDAEVNGENGKFSKLSQKVDGIYTEVNGENGKFSKLSQKVDGIDTIVNDPSTGYTKLSQKVNGIYADVYDSTGKLETSLKATKDGLTATINGLQVGCTNMLRNTRNPQNASHWTRGNVVLDSELNENVFYLTNSSTTETTAGTNRVRVEAGKEYTVSAYVKRTANVKNVDFFFLSRRKDETTDFTFIQSKTNMAPTPDKWEKLTWTFVMAADAYEGYLRIDHNGSSDGKASTLYYTMIKMEKGNRVTDWSPSPEEVDERIAGASATATNYLNFSSNGLVVGNHTATTLRGNVLIDTDSVDIRNGTTVLSTFTADSVRLGLSTNKNVVVNTDGVHMYEGSTYMAYFKPTEVRLGNKSGSNANIKIATNAVEFRAGNTVTATYGANDIHLGLNAQDTTIHLCADIGRITGYEDQYGMGMSINSSVVALNAENRIILYTSNDSSIVRRGEALLSLFPADSSGNYGPSINLQMMDQNLTTNSYDYSSLKIETKNMYLLVEDNDANTSGWVDITPTQVEIGPFIKTSSLSTNYAWINNIGFDGENHVLWSGGYYMTEGHEITLSESVTSQPNGIVLVFSEYADGASKNQNFQTFFVPKHAVKTHAGQGFTFKMANATLSLFATKYLYIYNTSIKGYANNSYVDTAATASGLKRTNNRFVLRYVVGV